VIDVVWWLVASTSVRNPGGRDPITLDERAIAMTHKNEPTPHA